MIARKSQSVPVRRTERISNPDSPFTLLQRPRRFLSSLGFEEPWFNEMLEFPMTFRAEGQLIPPVDIFETDKEVIVKATLPGIDPKDIKVECCDNTLCLSGEISRDETVKNIDYYRREIACGEFTRRVTLPSEVKAENARAEYRNGVLEVHLPKVQTERRQTVHVPVESKK